MGKPIYLDYQSTTPVDKQVLAAMLPYFGQEFGNAASRTHAFGWRAEEAVERAREQVAALIGADPKALTWTSGATESTNLAIRGVAEACRGRGNHIVTAPTEHKATIDTCQYLAEQGFEITYLPVDATGSVAPADLERVLTPRTILISVMHANNEVGTIHDIVALGRIARKAGVLLHVDAAQTLGKLPLDLQAMPVDLLSLSAHKLYGPKGVGALYVRRREPRIRLAPLIHGGGHERGLRSGTLNVPGIVGFGAACALAAAVLNEEPQRLTALTDRLYRGISDQLPDVFVNGHKERRLPNNLNLSFAGVENEPLILSMKEIAVSSGSACTSANPEPSYVLRAMGVPEELAHGSVRFSVGRFTTELDIEVAIETVVRNVNRLRRVSKQYAVGSRQ